VTEEDPEKPVNKVFVIDVSDPLGLLVGVPPTETSEAVTKALPTQTQAWLPMRLRHRLCRRLQTRMPVLLVRARISKSWRMADCQCSQ